MIQFEKNKCPWLRQELTRRVEAPQLVEEHASLIEAGERVRDKMSHGPHFDRPTPRLMNRGQVTSYDVDRTIKELKHDSHALALLISLRDIAHALLVDRAFGIKNFRPISDVKVATV